MGDMEDLEPESVVQRFYRGRRVLVTGATGFLGKVLVEKLLRSTEVHTVFLLVRAKRGRTGLQRTYDYFDDVVFSRLREEAIPTVARVKTIEGDLSVAGLGLRAEDAALLRTQVEIILHGVSTVRLDEALDSAIKTNVLGTKEVLHFARNIAHLKAFVYVSTIYANCPSQEIREEFFEAPLAGDNAISLVKCLSSRQMADITKGICGEYPNTFAFTKAIAENVIKEYGEGLPVVVFRPAIIASTADEPLEGCIDDVYGPTSVLGAVVGGVLRALQVNVDCEADIVPVDLVANAILVSAWEMADRGGPSATPIYNFVSSRRNPLPWGKFIALGLRHGRTSPTVKAPWYCTTFLSKYRPVYLFYKWLLHLLPASIIDSVFFITGHKPRMLELYKKVHKFTEMMSYFGMRRWHVHEDRVPQLWDRLSERDRVLFNFDITSIHWNCFYKSAVYGLRVSYFKDSPDTITAAKRKQFYLWILHYLLLGLTSGLSGWALWYVCSFFVHCASA